MDCPPPLTEEDCTTKLKDQKEFDCFGIERKINSTINISWIKSATKSVINSVCKKNVCASNLKKDRFDDVVFSLVFVHCSALQTQVYDPALSTELFTEVKLY